MDEIKYTILYHPEIQKDIAPFPRDIKARIHKAIEQKLLRDPLKFGEPLKRSLRGYRKMRVGDYRVIYRIESNEIFVLKIGHRREIYRKDRRDEF